MNHDAHIEAVDSAKGRVTLSFDTHAVDVPTVDITAGSISFKGLNFKHKSGGQDIWNGNSAVSIRGLAGKVVSICTFRIFRRSHIHPLSLFFPSRCGIFRL